MSALPKDICDELRETFFFVAEERGLDAAIQAVALLGERLGSGDRVADELSQLLGAVALHCGVDTSLILGRSRHYAATEPRQVFMLVAWRSGYSKTQIGEALGRNHSTIIHGIRTAERVPSLLASAERILEILGSEQKSA